MRWRWLNPLQWNFGPRSTATLLTWAVVPMGVAIYVVWSRAHAIAVGYGLPADQIASMNRQILTALLWTELPLLIICIAAAVLFSWVVVQPILRLRKGMEAIERGDLTQEAVRVSSRDEIGQITGSFNAMAASLRHIITDLSHSSTELEAAGQGLQRNIRETSAATHSSAQNTEKVRQIAEGQVSKAVSGTRATEELRQAALQVATAAEAQAHEVSEVAETVHEVTRAIVQVTSAAGVVSEAAGHTREAADAGVKSVQAVSGGMNRIHERVMAASDQVKALRESLAHVDEILQLISEIADQTDLLALNAAIEAARVGEHGKGFAVVAGEVRQLAERSRRAAGEIGGRVEAIRSGAEGVVTTIASGTEEVTVGADLARDAQASLERILQAVDQTLNQVESISESSRQIQAASKQVETATSQLSAIAAENAATAEQMQATAEAVSGMVASVETGARESEQATAAMAAAASQVTSAVDAMMAGATQMGSTASILRSHVARFRTE